MKITKYEHACLVVEVEGRRLVIDPGIYAKSLTDFQNIDAVVVTHSHADHFDLNLVASILGANPSAKVFATQTTANKIKNIAPTIIKPGDSGQAGPFNLQFFGGQHAYIHGSYPNEANVGVMINNTLYYPGDSFAKPIGKVRALAVPADAPWMKIGEAMDLIIQLKPEIVFPTHTIFLSELGEGLTDSLLGSVVQPSGGSYSPLKVGQSIEID